MTSRRRFAGVADAGTGGERADRAQLRHHGRRAADGHGRRRGAGVHQHQVRQPVHRPAGH